MSAAANKLKLVICVNRMRGPRGKCCGQGGSPAIADALERGVRERGLAARVERIVCLGKCDEGPNLKYVGGEFRQHLTLGDVPSLLDEVEAMAGKAEAGSLLHPGA